MNREKVGASSQATKDHDIALQLFREAGQDAENEMILGILAEYRAVEGRPDQWNFYPPRPDDTQPVFKLYERTDRETVQALAAEIEPFIIQFLVFLKQTSKEEWEQSKARMGIGGEEELPVTRPDLDIYLWENYSEAMDPEMPANQTLKANFFERPDYLTLEMLGRLLDIKQPEAGWDMENLTPLQKAALNLVLSDERIVRKVNCSFVHSEKLQEWLPPELEAAFEEVFPSLQIEAGTIAKFYEVILSDRFALAAEADPDEETGDSQEISLSVLFGGMMAELDF